MNKDRKIIERKSLGMRGDTEKKGEMNGVG